MIPQYYHLSPSLSPLPLLQDILKMFLQRALEKILADKEIKKSYNSEIKQECDDKLSKFSSHLDLVSQIFHFFTVGITLTCLVFTNSHSPPHKRTD